MDNRGFARTGTAPTARSGPRRRVQRRKRDRNGFSLVLSELRAFQARRQADSEAGPGLGDQLRHQG